MINKKEFIKLMIDYISLKADEDNLDNAMKKFDPDFGSFACMRYDTLFITALEYAMEDKENQWISYWVYELDCGKKATKDSVSIEGKNKPIKTLSNLWDLIVNMSEWEKAIKKEK